MPSSSSAADSSAAGNAELDRALRRYLEAVACETTTVSYRQALDALAIAPPRSMQKLTQALERSMRDDVAAGRALRAAVVVSGSDPALPRPGFFACVCALGRYDGPETGAVAARFHARALAELHAELGVRPDNRTDTPSDDAATRCSPDTR